jgi:hypothetical protein
MACRISLIRLRTVGNRAGYPVNLHPCLQLAPQKKRCSVGVTELNHPVIHIRQFVGCLLGQDLPKPGLEEGQVIANRQPASRGRHSVTL